MSPKRILGSCTILLMLSMVTLSAARSDVADAVMKGDAVALRTLLAQHADVNAPQPDGATALQWAVYRSDIETAKLLIAAGADAKAANRDG
ncbi:MAG TPA: ankyrin repeat domain-containing protein, partial [Vicinamibacterales bacterium]|nr:ankyrin repeat domain-containing protein [Vicinamibacterales bacterium]